MKTIMLTKGFTAVVDDKDFELVSAHKWHAKQNSDGTWYAYATIHMGKIDGKRKQTSMTMHRLILGLVPGSKLETDHKDRNGLNNTRDNLRICTKSQNACNRSRGKLPVSGYKGVRSKNGKWFGTVTKGGVQRYTGMYVTPEEAALAYNALALEIHGEFASLSIVPTPGLSTTPGSEHPTRFLTIFPPNQYGWTPNSF